LTQQIGWITELQDAELCADMASDERVDSWEDDQRDGDPA
jgi:hypothetical protein